jgi:hypothetical protein
MMKNDFLIFSGGPNCRPTHYLKKYELRDKAFPLDWQICSLKDATHLYKTGFKDFFNDYKEYPERLNKTKKLRYVVDTKNHIVSMHHVSSEKALDIAVSEFVELMKKRFNDLNTAIKKQKRIIILSNHAASYQSLKCFIQNFTKLYSGKDFTLVNVHNRKNGSGRIHTKEISRNARIIEFFFHDVHKNGSDPVQNPNFWYGNEEEWDNVMHFIIDELL